MSKKHVKYSIPLYEYTLTGQLAVVHIFGYEIYRRIGARKKILWSWIS